MVSLSQNGCLLRSTESLALGSELDVSFELPRFGRIDVRAEVSYQLVPDLGLVFCAVSSEQRAAIEGFVNATLCS